jgi:multidrug efflux pump subunit AcrB
MSRFFIDRPIFSGVIAILFVMAGLIAAKVLPIAQYPEISPPTVTITANYPGASAETVARTVAAPIEEQLSGVENLVYFSSSASSNGALNITATFEVGADVNKAVIDVNNRIAIALPRLPDDVRRNGVVAQKRSTDILFVVAISSNDPRYDTLFLSNYATVNILDELKRVPEWPTPPSSARATTRCASGCGPTRWPSSALPPRTSPLPCARRTTSTPPARSDRSLRRTDRRWSTRSPRAGG